MDDDLCYTVPPDRMNVVIEHSKEDWMRLALKAGKHEVECLRNDECDSEANIIHHRGKPSGMGYHIGKVYLRLAYWRCGELQERFLELDDLD